MWLLGMSTMIVECSNTKEKKKFSTYYICKSCSAPKLIIWQVRMQSYIDMIPRIDSAEDIDSIKGRRVAGITFRISRLRSSLSSLYANYDFY